jgi:hypothetical protein
LVDLDGDGKLDIISGSYHPGDLYLFRRLPDGNFAGGEILKDRHGKPLQFVAAVPFAADWNGDGVLDLIVGNIQGEVFYVPNEGTAKQPAFGSPRKLSADGKEIKAPHGDSGPAVADWDGDRIPDLIVACGDGSVVWYRNLGTAKEPKLGPGKTLVPASPEQAAWSGKLKDGEHGVRAKICVTDWNGDGKLDLLLGDLSTSQGEKPKLSKEDEEAAAKANKRRSEVIAEYSREGQAFLHAYQTVNATGTDEAKKSMQKLFSDLYRLANEASSYAEVPAKETPEAKTEREKNLSAARARLEKGAADVLTLDKAPPDETPEAKKERERKLLHSTVKFFTLQSEMSKLSQVAQKGQAPHQYHGHVWVFLRQGPVAVKP